MAKKISIRKLLVALSWSRVFALLLVVLIAAINKTNDASCADIRIEIRGTGDYRFIDKSDVLSLMGASSGKAFRGQNMASIDLRTMEQNIRKNPWVREAELYFNAERELEVLVKERTPVARVFTAAGQSWYLDTAGTYLPLAVGKPAVKLPVFTGMPEKLLKKRRGDSALIARVLSIVECMNKDPFWEAQIAQVVYTADKRIELVPVLGQHRILFGDGSDAEKKFRRLKKFYTEVLSKTGLDYYRTIDVGYANQVVGKKAGSISTSVDKNKPPYSLAAAPLQVNSPISSEAKSKSGPNPLTTTTGERKPKAVMRRS
jgi:cell division protein FtsQ